MHVVANLHRFLTGSLGRTWTSRALAYTLQVGREAMEERLALIVNSLEEFADKLAAHHGRAALMGAICIAVRLVTWAGPTRIP